MYSHIYPNIASYAMSNMDSVMQDPAKLNFY